MCILQAVDGLFELRFSWIWLVRSPHRILEYKYITHGLILEYKILYSSRPQLEQNNYGNKFFQKNNYFSFNVFFVFFYARSISNIYFFGNIEKCPFTYWLNGEVVSPNSRYREFEHEVNWKVVSPDSRQGQWDSISNIYKTNIVVLASEPVGGISRGTELPCLRMKHWIKKNTYFVGSRMSTDRKRSALSTISNTIDDLSEQDS